MINLIASIVLLYFIVNFYIIKNEFFSKRKYLIYGLSLLVLLLINQHTFLNALIAVVILSSTLLFSDSIVSTRHSIKIKWFKSLVYLVFVIFYTKIFIMYNVDQVSKELLIALGVVIILEPSSVFISDLLYAVFKESKDNVPQEVKVGRYIGYLERLLILLLCLLDGVVAIGFVLTAKTIARYPDINNYENNNFREKYILGTMLSCCIPIILIYFLNKM